MTQKIALPMGGGKLSTHFGHCEYFAIVEVKDKKIVKITKETPPDHKPGVYPRWIASLGVTDVIAGGIGQRAIDLFMEMVSMFMWVLQRKVKRSLLENF